MWLYNLLKFSAFAILALCALCAVGRIAADIISTRRQAAAEAARIEAARIRARQDAAARAAQAEQEKAEKEAARAEKRKATAEKKAEQQRRAEERAEIISQRNEEKARRQAEKLEAARQLAEYKERALAAEKALRALRAEDPAPAAPAAPAEEAAPEIAPAAPAAPAEEAATLASFAAAYAPEEAPAAPAPDHSDRKASAFALSDFAVHAPARADTHPDHSAAEAPEAPRRTVLQCQYNKPGEYAYSIIGTAEEDLPMFTTPVTPAFLLDHFESLRYYLNPKTRERLEKYGHFSLSWPVTLILSCANVGEIATLENTRRVNIPFRDVYEEWLRRNAGAAANAA